MPNWLADPEKCAIRLRKEEGGCIILAGRNEVMSRSTRVYRDAQEAVGKQPEETTWQAGNIDVIRKGPDQRRDMGKPNLFLRVWQTARDCTTIGPMLPTEAIMAADVLRAAAVNSGGSACGGETILDLLWQEMMAVYERLMTGQAAEHDVGIAQGIAYAIAVMQNPYLPSIDAVREQAAERWEVGE